MAKKTVYDGEFLFRTWCGWGAAASNPMLMEFCRTNYNTSSQMGPTYAMWKWAFNNPEQAYPLYKEFWFDKYPDRPPLEFKDFLQLIVKEHGKNQSVVGAKSKRNLERFCAKYGLEIESSFSAGEVVQVVRRNHVWYQSLWIVAETNGKKVTAFTVTPEGRTEQEFDANEVGFIGKAIYPSRHGLQVLGMSLVPRLESIAQRAGTPFKRLEANAKEGIEVGYRFWYAVKRYGEWGETSFWYPDFDTGIEVEIERLRVSLQQPEPVV